MFRPADRDQLDRLVVDQIPAALRFARRLTGSADEAEDVVQEALAKQGFTTMEMGPEEFGKFYAAEAAKWAKVVSAVGLSR